LKVKITLLFVLFLVLLLFRAPVAFILGLLSVGYIFIFMDVPLQIVLQRMGASLDSFPLLALPLYIFVGNIMYRLQITDRLLRFAQSMVGSWKGGLAQVNVVALMIFSGLSGSALADTAGMGSVVMRLMIKEGYPKAWSAALTGSLAVIGPMIPPSVAFVLYGIIAEVSIGRLFLGGVFPGFVVGAAFMAMNWVVAGKRNFPVTPKSEIPPFFKSALEAVPALTTIGVILGGMVFGIFTTTEAAGVAAAYAIFLGFCYRTITFKTIIETSYDTALLTGVVMFILACSCAFQWVVTIEQVPIAVAKFILSISHNKYVVIAILNVIYLILGCIMETVAIIFLTTPIFVPLIKMVGIDPVHFGVFMVFNLCIGLVTPPFAMGSFITSKMAETSFQSVVRESGWMILVLVVVLALVSYFPALSTWLGNTLM
jgi:tripartite ATP-independent transporter DctM subunit